jgi:acetylornithine deacetylase/succinyl-diaminopimelate desuccinylase-like protein
MTDVQQEVTDVLQRLIRFNTVNPPGNERPLQEYLAQYLASAGLEVELLGRSAQRPNLIARLRPAHPGGDGPALCLLSHVDTVLATPSEWERDPWSGDVVDGWLWGRGAIDMKSQTAAEVVAVASLARSGWRPARGELLVVALVDEETGGGEGAMWLTEHHRDKVRCDFVINEGAGPVIPYDGRRIYAVCVAEKGVFRFTVTTAGVAGHASIPKIGDNALLKMAPLLQAMADHQPAFDVTEAPRAMLEGLGVDVDGDPSAALEVLRAHDPLLATLVEPMLGVTLAPTRIEASEKINVIPSRARLQVDCRVPPGLGEERALARIREVLGPEGYAIEFNERVVGNGSPVESELMDVIRRWVEANDPGATVVPTILPGFTDSRTFREAFPDVVAYGFMPHRHMTLYDTAPLVHGPNERIDVRDLGFATGFFSHAVSELLG